MENRNNSTRRSKLPPPSVASLSLPSCESIHNTTANVSNAEHLLSLSRSAQKKNTPSCGTPSTARADTSSLIIKGRFDLPTSAQKHIAAHPTAASLINESISNINNNENKNNNNNNSNGIFTPSARSLLSSTSKRFEKEYIYSGTGNTPYVKVSSTMDAIESHKAITMNYKVSQDKYALQNDGSTYNSGKAPKQYYKRLVNAHNEATGGEFKVNTVSKVIQRKQEGKTPRKLRPGTKRKKKGQENDTSKPKRNKIIQLINNGNSCSDKNGNKENAVQQGNFAVKTKKNMIIVNNHNSNKKNKAGNDNNEMDRLISSCRGVSPLRPKITAAAAAAITTTPSSLPISNSLQSLQVRNTAHTCKGGARFNESSTEHVKKLLGFLFGSFMGQRRRLLENCTTLFKNNSSKRRIKNPHLDLLGDNEMKYDIFQEGTDIVFYSSKCQSETTEMSNGRCDACRKARKSIHDLWRHVSPPGWNNKNNEIDRKSNVRYIASHPLSAERRILDDAARYRIVQKENMALRFKSKKFHQSMIQCDPGSEFELAAQKVVEEANNKFDEYQKEYNTSDSGEEKSQQKSLWEISLEHLNNVKQRNEKMRGIRLHPAFLNMALTIIANTSIKVYSLIAPALKLPDVSYVLRIQKKRGGGQDERKSICGVVDEGCRILAEEFDEYGVVDDRFRKVHVSYDSMTCVESIDHDIHTGPSGIDPHLNFNVITAKFRNMVSNKYIRSVMSSSISPKLQ